MSSDASYFVILLQKETLLVNDLMAASVLTIGHLRASTQQYLQGHFDKMLIRWTIKNQQRVLEEIRNLLALRQFIILICNIVNI